MISLWFEKPDLKSIEPLIDEMIPVAVETLGGLSERDSRPYIFQVAMPSALESGVGEYLTAFSSIASDEVEYVGLGSSLVSELSKKSFERFSLEVLRVRLEHVTTPQRLLEKLTGTIEVRPSRLEVANPILAERLWVHSIFLLGLEGVELRVRHFLQDSKGRFLPDPEKFLRRLHDQAIFAKVERLPQIPKEHAVQWADQLSEDALGQEFHATVAGLQKIELARAEAYYDELLADLNRRASSSAASSRLTFKSKIDRVQKEREVRLKEIVDRYRSQIIVQPVGVRFLCLPAFRCQFYSLAVPSAILEVYFSPMLKEFLPIECPNCQSISKSFTLSCAKFVCQVCV